MSLPGGVPPHFPCVPLVNVKPHYSTNFGPFMNNRKQELGGRGLASEDAFDEPTSALHRRHGRPALAASL